VDQLVWILPRFGSREQSRLCEPVAGVGSDNTYQVFPGYNAARGVRAAGAVCAEIRPSDGLRLPTR
jgi:hypothetical protein